MFFLNKYWINRIYKKINDKGILSICSTAANFLNKTLNPKHTGEFPLKYLFIKKRKLLKNFSKIYLDILDDFSIITIANYYIKSDLLNEKSVIYSFGIGENLSFEKKLADLYNLKVYCFDPTSLAIKFMSNEIYDKNKIFFKPFGIWNKDGKVKFFIQDEQNASNSGGSITNLFKNFKYDLLDCFKLSTLMKLNNHSKVDILKLDIEGAAPEVMENIIDEKIQIKQIVVEFEYSEDDNIDDDEFYAWSERLKKIIIQMRKNGYKCYNLPRYSHIPYSTIEILFVRQ